jgi:hypothetical protein
MGEGRQLGCIEGGERQRINKNFSPTNRTDHAKNSLKCHTRRPPGEFPKARFGSQERRLGSRKATKKVIAGDTRISEESERK